jgi:hypothetical protein
MGAKRELKSALEHYWSGKIGEAILEQAALELRKTHWRLQVECGIPVPPSNDFSLYDQVLDTAFMLRAIPGRFRPEDTSSLETYFHMARGSKQSPAMEMTKWFDTNYHYIVPEFEEGMTYRVHSTKPVNEYLGETTRHRDTPGTVGAGFVRATGQVQPRQRVAGSDFEGSCPGLSGGAGTTSQGRSGMGSDR